MQHLSCCDNQPIRKVATTVARLAPQFCMIPPHDKAHIPHARHRGMGRQCALCLGRLLPKPRRRTVLGPPNLEVAVARALVVIHRDQVGSRTHAQETIGAIYRAFDPGVDDQRLIDVDAHAVVAARPEEVVATFKCELTAPTSIPAFAGTLPETGEPEPQFRSNWIVLAGSRWENTNWVRAVAPP